MSGGKKIIAFVPARKGSKGIALKNIRGFAGRPLIQWVLEALQNSIVDQIVVSTDGSEISETVKAFNYSKVEVFERDASTATDNASTESAMLDYLNRTSHDASSPFVLVQATSPFLKTSDINDALDEYESGHVDSILSVVKNHSFLWDDKGNSVNYDFRKRARRQDMAPQYQENGSFYINTVGNIIRDNNRLSGKIGYYIMDKHTAIELDDLEDWRIAEIIMQTLGKH